MRLETHKRASIFSAFLGSYPNLTIVSRQGPSSNMYPTSGINTLELARKNSAALNYETQHNYLTISRASLSVNWLRSAIRVQTGLVSNF